MLRLRLFFQRRLSQAITHLSYNPCPYPITQTRVLCVCRSQPKNMVARARSFPQGGGSAHTPHRDPPHKTPSWGLWGDPKGGAWGPH